MATPLSFDHFVRARSPLRATPRHRPTLETLEDRCLMATRIWDGGSATNNWANANNWQGNIAPVGGDDLIFPAGVADKTADNNFGADTFFNSITVAGGYNLRGARFRVGAGGIISSGSSNIINNDIDLGGSGNALRPILVNAGSTLFLDGGLVGAGGFAKSGSGDLSLRNNNSYGGLTDILAGRLFIEKDESLGAFNVANAGTIIRSGATLLVNDQALGTIRTDEPITVAGGGTIRAINDVHLRGNIATTGIATLKHEGSIIERLLITGQISGSGGITIASGSGQVWLKGDVGNTYTGTTTVNGKLRLDNSSGNAVTNNLQINGTGAVRLQQSDQIADHATVTVSNGGGFFGNARRDTFRKLQLLGGRGEGFELDPLDFLLRKDPASRILDLLVNIDNARVTVDEFEATSTATLTASFAAELLGMNVYLTNEQGVANIPDGPVADDFIANGFLGHDGLSEDTITIQGGGTIKIPNSRLSLPGSNYTQNFHFVVNQGHLRLHQDEFDPTLLGPSETTRVTVNSGGRFSSTSRLGELVVNAGGRVRPGRLGTTVNLGIADVTFNDTGSFEVTENLVLNPGAILEVKLNGILPGVGFDQIKVGSAAIITGAILETILGPHAAVGQNYRILDKADAALSIGQFAVPVATAPFQIAPPTGQRLAFNYAGGSGNDVVLTLQNTPPMAPGLALDKTEIDEGGVVTATGHLVDPDRRDQLRLLVNWGDGSRVHTFRPGLNPFALRHRYRDDGVYTARFEWLDQNNVGNSREFQVTVNNVAPQATLGRDLAAAADFYFASGRFNDPGRDRVTATVDYGDGTSVHALRLGHGRFLLRHRYLAPGEYDITVTLHDEDGGKTLLKRTVGV